MSNTTRTTRETRTRLAVARTSKAQRVRHLERVREREARDEIAEAVRFTAEQAWAIAMNIPGGPCSVADLDGGGYAVPLDRRPIMPPSRTEPIRALVPSGEVEILPSNFGVWRVVARVTSARKAA